MEMTRNSKGVVFHCSILLRFISPYWKFFSISIFLTLSYSLSNVLIMPLVSDIAREVSNKNLDYFTNHIINAFILFSVRLNSKFFQNYIMEKASYSILLDMRLLLFNIIHYLPTEEYNDRKHGDIMTKIMDDCLKIKDVIFLNFETVLPNLVSLIGIVGYLFYLNWYLTLMTIIGAPIFFFTVTYFARRLRRVSNQLQQNTADITQMIQESFLNMKIIKIYLAEKRNVNKFKRFQKRYFDAFLKEVKFRIRRERIDAYVQFLLFLGVFWFGGFLVFSDKLSSESFMAFFTGLILLVDPVIYLTKVYSKTFQVTASIDRVKELLSKECLIETGREGKSQLTFERIEFKEVSFCYASSKDDVIKDFSCSISKGDVFGIVGPSGAGKSTIVNLINKFYTIKKGQLLIDGIDIQKISSEAVREHIAYVPQESIFFRGSILENCRIGNPKAHADEVVEALKVANAWEFVKELPGQLLAKIGTQGLNISGGQRQRLSIARAIVSQPSLLILDEATSALDSKSEAIVQQSIQALKGKFTMIIIAHRLSTVRDASTIIVLDQGQIVEQGNHDSLVKNNGLYNQLIQKQSGD